MAPECAALGLKPPRFGRRHSHTRTVVDFNVKHVTGAAFIRNLLNQKLELKGLHP
jgi:hypothetical protein